MVAVVDESTNMVYLFGDPQAEEKIDVWSRTGRETFDTAESADESDFMVDFSFMDLDMLVAA